ncbi:hypothetical protein KIN20_015262 [Parelaphostrongylus tenuis]|uniref:Uncharacterized protein n=1 Tax=Parelaphostrongylus tenuis TaxID=148309 RepID=A0AAD5MY92_PARTN|nr:hypothetical protein KIN20_015262 [Parelaphostrongylus tenuis]
MMQAVFSINHSDLISLQGAKPQSIVRIKSDNNSTPWLSLAPQWFESIVHNGSFSQVEVDNHNLSSRHF